MQVGLGRRPARAENPRMAERMRWWVIPGAMVVLLRVVTLAEPAEPAEQQAASTAAAAAREPNDLVLVRDAAGNRYGPLALGLVAGQALVLAIPPEHRGQRGVMTIWRRVGGAREPQPWLVFRARVRSDASVPIAGLPGGRYDLEFELGDGQDARRLFAHDAAAPGAVALQPLP